MNDNQFWVLVNTIIATAIVAIVMLSTEYWRDHNTKIVKLIESGVNPVAAMCAMQDDYGEMPVCIVLATKSIGGKHHE